MDVSLHFYLGKEAGILMAAPSTASNILMFPQCAAPVGMGQEHDVLRVLLPGEWLAEIQNQAVLPELKWMERDRGMKESKAGMRGEGKQDKMISSHICSQSVGAEVIWKPAPVVGCANEMITLIDLPLEMTGVMVYRRGVWV